MPFMKNVEGKICQVLDPEVSKLVKEGWKLLTDVEETAYREVLSADHKLTSSVEIEAARVKAGLYKALNGVKKEVSNVTKSVSKSKTSSKAKTNATK